MESLTRTKAQPTVFFILCLLVIFKLVTIVDSAQIDDKMYTNVSRKLLGRVSEKQYSIRPPSSNFFRHYHAPPAPPLYI
ncbi:hypothetical protein MKW92_013308 [Papaver armeniacum]|nr:hypothetical protein MKW92_013308 [Papaver armeniacum]